MKRVGILSLFYKTYNYGAQLQAYALQKVIQSLGYECEQIRFAWSYEETRHGYESASVNQAAFAEFAQQIPHSKRVYTSDSLEEANQEYDGFVCGSDQIWGVKNSMPFYILPQMALSFVQDSKRKIVYGASLGAADISEDRKEILRHFINRLDFISVRERSAILTLKKMTDKPVESVVDPVMLISAGEWSHIAENGGGRHPQEHYILFYTVSCNKMLYQRALDFALECNLSLVNLSYVEGISIGPFDFISFVEHADYVVTDSFHGSVLSILFHKQFISFGVDLISTNYSKNIRMKDMLEICGLEDRFFLRAEDGWESVLKESIDYEEVDLKITVAAVHSVEYLKKAFTNEEIEKRENKASKKLYEKVLRKGMCTGCTACTKCPVSAVKMVQNALGFYQPDFNYRACIDCGQCLELCPACNRREKSRVKNVSHSAYAMRARNEEILEGSSSGGAFPVFAKRVLEAQGIVCGAVYDRQNGFAVKHICINKEKELADLQKSKYVQSDLKGCFSEIEQYLKEGKEVLFTGTPCQTAGLKAYLKIDYKKLYTIDLICGGVTAPILWEKYTKFYGRRFKADMFNMRAKNYGFFRNDGKLAFSISHIREDGEHYYEKDSDLFLSTRMSFYNECCYHCNFKGGCHHADLTIGDYVGFNLAAPEENDNKGVSLMVVRNKKGQALFEECEKDFIFHSCSYQEACRQNEMIGSSMKKPLGTDYLRGMAPDSTIERLYYETKQIRLLQEKEALFRQFLHELKRNELLLKLKKYASFQCKAEYDPLSTGDIVIYGAGKLGQALLDCLEKEPVCFLDQSNRHRNLCGCPVYRLEDMEFRELYIKRKMTVLVTPVWDFWEIREQLEATYPKLNVVSVERLVEKI